MDETGFQADVLTAVGLKAMRAYFYLTGAAALLVYLFVLDEQLASQLGGTGFLGPAGSAGEIAEAVSGAVSVSALLERLWGWTLGANDFRDQAYYSVGYAAMGPFFIAGFKGFCRRYTRLPLNDSPGVKIGLVRLGVLFAWALAAGWVLIPFVWLWPLFLIVILFYLPRSAQDPLLMEVVIETWKLVLASIGLVAGALLFL